MSRLWPSLLLLEENVDLLINKIYFYNEVLCGLSGCMHVYPVQVYLGILAVYEFPWVHTFELEADDILFKL
jgi:hypothetical protein